MAPPVARPGGPAVDIVYIPEHTAGIDYDQDVGDPGQFPFTRGLHPQGYASRLWTMRQFAGFGTPEETNARYRHLLAEGGTGLSVAFDLPTLMGRDPDHPLAEGEVGKCGVSVASVHDMERLFSDIPLDRVSVSMTINGPAPMVLALYLAVAEARGVAWSSLTGTLQNDILKEFIAEKEFIYPPRPSMRLVTDVIAFCTAEVPRWNSISISGYHIREAGSTAAQELAFTLRDGIEYVDWAIAAGLDVDAFAPRLSFFFNAQSDLFEEVAKFRAARRLWARIMRERFGARDPRSWQLRMHTQTAGVSLTAQQPLNNVVRTALQALSAVLGGTNSLHTNALDEALALPTRESATLALRTQQMLAHESGLAEVVDPFGGSWFVERLTTDLEREAERLIDGIDRAGGMVAAIEQGLPQREIADAAYRDQLAVERGERVVIGVNAHADDGVPLSSLLSVDASAQARQVAGVTALRQARDGAAVARALGDLRETARGTGNTMPAFLACARAQATVGEMCDVLRDLWGEYQEPRAI